LKAAVAKSSGLRDQEVGIIGLHVLAARGKQLRQLLGEVQIIADDDCERRRQYLWRIVGRSKRCKPTLSFSTPDPHEPRRTRIGRSWTEFHYVVNLPQLFFVNRAVSPAVAGAGCS